MDDETLIKRLKAHPRLKNNVESILHAINSHESEIRNADAIEEYAIKATRQIGNDVIQYWAENEAQRINQEYEAHTNQGTKDSKKKFTG